MFRTLTVIAAGAALTIGGTVAVALPAHASPVPVAQGAQPFTVRCPHGHRVFITLPAGDEYLVGGVAGSGDSFVPYRFDYRWADAGGHVVSRSEAHGAAGAVPRSAVTCTFQSAAYPDGTVLSFTVTGVIRAQE